MLYNYLIWYINILICYIWLYICLICLNSEKIFFLPEQVWL